MQLRLLFVHPRRRVILGLFTMNMLWLQMLSGQRLYTSFGQVADRSLGFIPAGLATRVPVPGGRAEVAILSQTPPALHLFRLGDDGLIALLGTTPLAGRRESLCAADLDGEAAFLSLTSDGSAVSCLKLRGKTYAETLIPVASKSQRLAVADINNDGMQDILLYGKNRAGVSTLLGQQGGKFVPGPELFTDVSISDLKTVDINGDGIRDVIVCDWLSNKLTIFYGISRMVFSEQVSVDLPGEPGGMAFTWLPRHRTLGMAVALPKERKIVFLQVTPAGDMHVGEMMHVPASPLSVEFALINNDTFPDLVAPTDRGTLVSVGAGAFEFSPPALLGPGANPAGWAVADLDGDKRMDFAIAEQESHRLVFLANAQHSGGIAWPAAYAVGSRPHGLAIGDLDGDGLPDIAVANSHSSTISVLFNKGKGRFTGGQTLFVADQPEHLLAPVPAVPSWHGLVSSHTATDRVGVTELSGDAQSATSFAIPAGSHPFVLRAWRDSVSLRMLVRYNAREGGSASLSLFEQISGQQFLERSLRPSLPGHLSAVTMDPHSEGSPYAIAFVSAPTGSSQSTLSIAGANETFSIGAIRHLLAYPDSTSSTDGLIPATLTAGGLRDLIVVLGPPVNGFMLCYRNPDGSFRADPEWIRDVRIAGDDDVIVRDLDGDGRPDIVVRNEATDEVVTFYGGIQGFGKNVHVCSARGVSAIAVAPLVSKGIQDLVLSHGDEGTIAIVFNPFRR